MTTSSTQLILQNILDNKNENVFFKLAYCENSSNSNANGDYSSGTTNFNYDNDSGYIQKVKKILIYLQDNGASLTTANFGQGTALTNGIRLFYNDGAKQYFTGIEIKNNLDILKIAKEVKYDELQTGNMIACFTPTTPILLQDTDKFGFDCRDNQNFVNEFSVQLEIHEIR